MRFSKLFQKKNSPDRADLVAATLYDIATRKSVSETYPNMSVEDTASVEKILHFTRIAIIVTWLRLFDKKAVDNVDWQSILKKFENLAFSFIDEIRDTQVEYVNHLIALCHKLNKLLGSSDDSSSPEFNRSHRAWWEEWLAPISPNKEIVETFGYKFGLQLSMLVFYDITQLQSFIRDVGQKTRSS